MKRKARCGTRALIVIQMCWMDERDFVVIDDLNKLTEYKLDAATEVCTDQKLKDLGFTPTDVG